MGMQPHVHTAEEVKAAINKIEHNSQGSYGAPTGIAGGSAGNNPNGNPEGVRPTSKGADWASQRKA